MIRIVIGIVVGSLALISQTLANLSISGIVQDAAGNPLPWLANIICTNTSVGTVPDMDWAFILSSTLETCNLEISHVWFITKQLGQFDASDSPHNIGNIILQTSNEQLDEVTIIAPPSGNNCQSSQYRVWINGAPECENKVLCSAGSSRATKTEEYTTDDGDTNIRVVGQYCKHDLTGEPIWPLYDGWATDPTDNGYGIRCDPTRLMHGECGMDIYNMLGIRQSNPDTTPDEFVQDIVLTATTFIGTVLTFALVVSALMIIFGGADENRASQGRRGIKYALIGYVLVLCSYLIIRLVQYIAG